MDQGPDGELTPRKPAHSAKRPVVQSPGSEQDAPPKQRLRTIESANAEMSVDASAAPGKQGTSRPGPRDPVQFY